MMFLYYIYLFLYILIIFLVSVIIHEAGHYIYIFLFLNQKPRISWRKGNIEIRFRKDISPIHKLNVALWGYLFGFFPIWFFTGAGEYFLIFLAFYTFGSKHDLKLIYNMLKLLGWRLYLFYFTENFRGFKLWFVLNDIPRSWKHGKKS